MGATEHVDSALLHSTRTKYDTFCIAACWELQSQEHVLFSGRMGVTVFLKNRSKADWDGE